MKNKDAINMLESLVEDPCRGLPEDIFLLISRLMPLTNVDLLIKDEKNRTLMTWRDDGYYKPGWHIPGGIIRYKETIAQRIKAVADSELGVKRVEFESIPVVVNEVIHPTRKDRGHFVSLLFKCSLVTLPDESNRYIPGEVKPKPSEWMWHNGCPEDLIDVHKMYRRFI